MYRVYAIPYERSAYTIEFKFEELRLLSNAVQFLFAKIYHTYHDLLGDQTYVFRIMYEDIDVQRQRLLGHFMLCTRSQKPYLVPIHSELYSILIEAYNGSTVQPELFMV